MVLIKRLSLKQSFTAKIFEKLGNILKGDTDYQAATPKIWGMRQNPIFCKGSLRDSGLRINIWK